jgi:hypothetical protein
MVTRITVVFLGFYYLTENGVLHTVIGDDCYVMSATVVAVMMHSVGTLEVCIFQTHVHGLSIHLTIELFKCSIDNILLFIDFKVVINV